MNKGLKTFLYGELTEGADGKCTYAKPAKLAGAIEAKVKFTNNDAEVYSDNVLAASDYSISSATLTLGIDNDDDSIFGPLLGYTADTEDEGAYDLSVYDTAKYVGFGYIVVKEDGYQAIFYRKVKFKPFIADAKTQQEKLTYTTPSVEGVASPAPDGKIIRKKLLATDTEAVTWLKGCFTQASA